MRKITLDVMKAAKSLYNMLPIIFGTVLLISLAQALIPTSFYPMIFQGDVISDSLIGGVLGSISAGSPVISYITGGELLEQGISLVAVTAFIVAWVTVGFVQLPAEAALLGKKFALIRNLIAFLFSIIVAMLTVLILGML